MPVNESDTLHASTDGSPPCQEHIGLVRTFHFMVYSTHSGNGVLIQFRVTSLAQTGVLNGLLDFAQNDFAQNY